MGRGRRGQVVSQTTKREIKKIEARKREDTYGFFNSQQKKKRRNNAGRRGFHRTFKKNRPRIIDYFVVKISILA